VIFWEGPSAGAEGTPVDRPLRLGMVNSLFRHRPQAYIEGASRVLLSLMETQTGLQGQIKSVSDPGTLGQSLQEGKVDLVLFHGFEFAWARARYPDLAPLVLVKNRRPLRACLVVRKDGKVTSIQDLKGKYVAVPVGARGHCQLFLERRCCPPDQKPAKFFKKVSAPIDAPNGLEDILDGLVSAAVVEQGDFEDYCRAVPGRTAQLKVLLQSESYPPGVIAYHAGKLPAEIVRRVRDGLLSATQSRQGKDLLSTCRMTGFENPPADFQKTLEETANAYPELDAR
jgi:ABC-type phosphate/phosphonate transport system substrate-binding protein